MRMTLSAWVLLWASAGLAQAPAPLPCPRTFSPVLVCAGVPLGFGPEIEPSWVKTLSVCENRGRRVRITLLEFGSGAISPPVPTHILRSTNSLNYGGRLPEYGYDLTVKSAPSADAYNAKFELMDFRQVRDGRLVYTGLMSCR